MVLWTFSSEIGREFLYTLYKLKGEASQDQDRSRNRQIQGEKSEDSTTCIGKLHTRNCNLLINMIQILDSVEYGYIMAKATRLYLVVRLNLIV